MRSIVNLIRAARLRTNFISGPVATKFATFALAASAVMAPINAYAVGDAGSVLTSFQTNELKPFGEILVVGAFLGGLVLVIVSLLKLWESRSEQSRVKLSLPIIGFFVGGGLMAILWFSGLLVATVEGGSGASNTAPTVGTLSIP